MKSIQPLWFLVAIVAIASSLCHGLTQPSNPTRSRSLPKSSFALPRTPALPPSSTALLDSTRQHAAAAAGEAADSSKVDWTALVKYSAALAAQLSLMFGFLTGIDKLVAHFSLKVPFAVHFVFLYSFNLMSSLFSIMPSSKEKKSGETKLTKEEQTSEFNNRKTPSWTPPGIAFVFGWPLLTFGLRAFTGAMVVEAMGGRYATPAIMSLMLHLSIGTLWNTVNNVEGRLGVSVILLYGLWLSKAFAAFQFYKVTPLAGKLLAATLTWITAACALETRTWQLNPDPDTKKREPLVPMQNPKWSTKFRWEQ